MNRKGLHLMLGSSDDLPAIRTILSEVAPDLGVNWVILEVDYHFAYQSQPELGEPGSIDHTQARELAGVANENGISLVPQFQCLSHQSFREEIFPLLREYPELDEKPDLDLAAFRFDNFHSWCPCQPQLYPIVFGLIDELIEAFRPPAVHIGLDEVFVLGECPRCRGAKPGDLFADTVLALHGHVTGSHRLETQMWGDRLIPQSLGYNMWECSHNGTDAALDRIPRDIVITDWHYEVMPDGEYPSVAWFQRMGFRVWPGGCYYPAAVEGLIDASRRTDDGRMLGYLATTWQPVADLCPHLMDERVEAVAESMDATKDFWSITNASEKLIRTAACVRLGMRLARD